MSSKKTVFQTKWFSVEQEIFDAKAGLGKDPYYRIHCSDGVLVLATTVAGEIVLIRQFRPILNEHTLEIPCGHVDPSESPRQAARRELYEETGYVCKRLISLGAGRLKMDRFANWEHAFLGVGAVKDPKFVAKEDIEVSLAPPAKLAKLISAGKFQQWSALALLLLADGRHGFRIFGNRRS